MIITEKQNSQFKRDLFLLKSFGDLGFITTFAFLNTVAIAQLVRASVCGTEGRGFEPHWPPLLPLKSLNVFKYSSFFHSVNNLIMLIWTFKGGFKLLGKDRMGIR